MPKNKKTTLQSHELLESGNLDTVGKIHDYEERKGEIGHLRYGDDITVELVDKKTKQVLETIYCEVKTDATRYNEPDRIRNNRWGFVTVQRTQ
tara:strand:+ start:347 stop:625 length:279 start_codon:yes stop_codon:yes gene_type:complete